MRIHIILIFSALMLFSCKEEKKTTAEVLETPISAETSAVTPDASSVFEETKSNAVAENGDSGSSLIGDKSNLNIDISLDSDQLFDFDKSVLKPEAEPQLQKVFDQINGKTDSKIEITGYTDAKGSAQYNKNLSEKRAEAVKTWLKNRGLQNSIFTQGKGAEDPVAPNTNADGTDNPEGRAKNRRVEIKAATQQSL